MTVKELIAKLQELPPDAKVLRVDGEYNGSTSPVGRVIYHEKASLAQHPNTVVIS